MGTKNKPGPFDCYANAHPDEPMFVLLGRDKHAPVLIWLWTVLRELDKEEPAKVKEAQDCIAAMFVWQIAHGRPTVGVGQAVMAGVLELMRAANVAVKNPPNAPSTIEAIRAYFCHTTFEGAGEGNHA
jgi:hypothetical protein